MIICGRVNGNDDRNDLGSGFFWQKTILPDTLIALFLNLKPEPKAWT